VNFSGTLGFLGFGNMGRAMACGLLETGTVGVKHLAAYDIDPARRAEAAEIGLRACSDAGELARESTVLLLAVKPQMMDEALSQIRPHFNPKTLVISIAAGISIAYIQQRLGETARVVRVMPNTPALVGAGAAGIALAPVCTEHDAAVARAIFEAVGIVEMVAEDALHAVTAVSGSGPAYFFYLVECLVKAAVAQGLPEAKAARLAAQTLTGAGLLLRHTAEPASVLRERVTSKGGTTEAALNAFRERGLDQVIGAGVEAAARRSRELGQ
jgi:pyrroline-5-carboxylate reductase